MQQDSSDRLENWVTYDLFPRHGLVQLPHCAGVYAIYFDDELIYVGSSTDISNRFCLHKFRYGYARNIHTPWGEVCDEVKVTVKVKRSRRLGDWAMSEIRLITRLKPRFNRQHCRRLAA